MKIKDIGKVITGKTPPTSHLEYFGGNIPFYTPTDIAKGFIVEHTERSITEDGFQSIYNNTIDGTSILVGCIGSDMGNVAISLSRSASNQQINSITKISKDHNPFYWYYRLSMMKDYFQSIAGSTATPLLPKSDFESIELGKCPSRDIQDSIANILTSLDHKISLNRKANEVLEKMAKQLYDYWFVQFDFPDENGKPYKSSGGKMVYNETLKREIPDGWEVKSINEVSESVRGVTYDRTDLIDDGILVLRGNNIQDNHLVYDNNTAYISENLVGEQQRIKNGDIIMTMSSGSKEHIGKCMMFNYNSEHTFGAFLNCFRPNKELQYYFFITLISERFKATIKRICGGTGINNLTSQSFDGIYLTIPDACVLQSFESKVKCMYDKYGQNELESLRLTSLRDFLLPMLMNGQVTIKNND